MNESEPPVPLPLRGVPSEPRNAVGRQHHGQRIDHGASVEGPESFRLIVGQLRHATPREDALVQEIPAPRQLAPHAVAWESNVLNPDSGSAEDHDQGDALATGRLVLLHDPAGHPGWGGQSRVVIYIRAELDTEMSNDPLLASVAWTWLGDALAHHGVQYSHAGGTATRILSESFGSLETRAASNQVELRASWTPSGHKFAAHLESWADMVCAFAGLPPLPDGVIALPHMRRN